jgi:hypothetical protein
MELLEPSVQPPGRPLRLSRYAIAEESYKEQGCLIVHPDAYPGYDSYFLTKTPKIVKDEDAIAESGTFTKIKNTFIKTMAKRGGSRVFLTRYIDIVAGQPVKKMVDSMYGSPSPSEEEKDSFA